MTDRLSRIEQLKQSIKYEEAMYEDSVAYPTDTAQYYRALEQTRQRINKMHEELAELESKEK